jgi:hypothetical protein
MADSVGAFALNHTGSAHMRSEDGVVVAHASYEGLGNGHGTIMGTLAFPLAENGASSGVCTWTGQTFPLDAPWTSSTGDGTWEQIEGRYAWKIHIPVLEISDGNKLRSEGELDLVARTFKGQLFEVSD